MQELTVRNYRFDNAKFLLVFFVVLLHFISPHRGGILTQQYVFTQNMYICLQLLAMPCFTIISGLFSSSELSDKSMVKIISKLIAPYILFELIFSYLARDYNTKLLIIEPFYILWYLLSLAIWRSLLPYFIQLKFPLLTSVVIALLIGFCGKIGDIFALGITFLYFPLFLLGFKLKKYKDVKANKSVQLAGLITLCFIIYMVYLLSPDNVRQFEPIYPYYYIYQSTMIKALGLRTFWMLISVVLSLSFLMLVSSKKCILSDWGKRSIYPYLLHVLVLLGIIDFGLYQYSGIPYILLLIGLALCTTIFLSTRLVVRLLHWLVEPDLKWLFKLKLEQGHKRDLNSIEK